MFDTLKAHTYNIDKPIGSFFFGTQGFFDNVYIF